VEAPTRRIELVRGDITRERVDAIVNAANTQLRPGGGVDGALTRAAGAEALAERERVIAGGGRPPLATGEAVATIAGDLEARWLIHTAGPIYSGAEEDRRLLESCHRSCLSLAASLGAGSIAFPAVSCGVYGFPPAEAAPIALSTAMGGATVPVIRFVLFDDELLETFLKAMAALAGTGGWTPGEEGAWHPSSA
jgi:O-acetyl-ADP-ribose deacetylase (regulator of RNase III)